MNTLKKITMVTMLGAIALSSTAAPSRPSEVFGITLPALSVATAEVSKTIAAVVSEQLRNALKAPRPARVRQSPIVSVVEGAEVIVVASRLPPLDPMKIARTAQVRL